MDDTAVEFPRMRIESANPDTVMLFLELLGSVNVSDMGAYLWIKVLVVTQLPAPFQFAEVELMATPSFVLTLISGRAANERTLRQAIAARIFILPPNVELLVMFLLCRFLLSGPEFSGLKDFQDMLNILAYLANYILLFLSCLVGFLVVLCFVI